MEKRIQDDLDQIFGDDAFLKIDPDFQIDAVICRNTGSMMHCGGCSGFEKVSLNIAIAFLCLLLYNQGRQRGSAGMDGMKHLAVCIPSWLFLLSDICFLSLW